MLKCLFRDSYAWWKMTAKTIKISKETYVRLSEVASELQMKLKRPVSLDEAVRYLLRLKEGGGVKITDLSDEEWDEVKASFEDWKKWRLTEIKT